MKKVLLLLVTAVLLVGGVGFWVAMAGSPKDPKQLKKVAVVSLSCYDKTLDNVAMIGRVSGMPELARELIVILKLVAIQQGMAGPDRARPWGIVVQADGDELTGCAFIPAPDLAKLASLLEPVVGTAESIGGGVYKIPGRSRPAYVTQKDGWAFFAYDPKSLETTPPDPIGALDDLNTQYDLALRVYASNIPSKCREQLLDGLKNRVAAYSQRCSREPEFVYTFRKKVVDAMAQPAATVLNDLDTATVGWALDTTARNTSVEFGVTAKENTPTSRAFASIRDLKSQFAGFRTTRATVVGNWTIQLPSIESPQVSASVDAFRLLITDNFERSGSSSDTVQVAKQLAADVADVVVASAHDGRVDGGSAVVLKPDAVTLLAGGRVADSAKVADAVHKLVGVATQREPAVAQWIKFDAAEHKSVRFHTLSIPIPQNVKDRQRVVALIGEKLETVVGVGPQSVYVAMGREPLAALKQVIDQSATEADKKQPVAEFSFALGAAAKFIAATSRWEKLRLWAGMVGTALDSPPDRDHVRVVVAPISNGAKCRVEVEEGVLKLIGFAVTMITGEEKKEEKK